MEDAESQAGEIEKTTENVAVTNLRRQRQPSQLTRFCMRIHQKEEKVVTTRIVKHVFNVTKITHILEIAQQKARNARNAKKKVILKDAADQR